MKENLREVGRIARAMKREGDPTDLVALAGFSGEESEQLYRLLQRVKGNIEVEWE